MSNQTLEKPRTFEITVECHGHNCAEHPSYAESTDDRETFEIEVTPRDWTEEEIIEEAIAGALMHYKRENPGHEGWQYTATVESIEGMEFPKKGSDHFYEGGRE